MHCITQTGLNGNPERSRTEAEEMPDDFPLKTIHRGAIVHSMALPPRIRELLQSACPQGRLLTRPAELAGYQSDGLGYKLYQPDAVLIPENGEELKAAVALMRTIELPYVIRGAGTSLSGGPVTPQGGIVVHTSRLRRVLQINEDERYCVVESGVVLNRLNELLAPKGLYYPPDPSSGVSATLGGNVACNAGGIHCFKYGVTGNYVLGVEAVFPDGRVRQFGGPAGGLGERTLDWKRLLVGSEGTLGTFTRFWLRVIPAPGKVWTFRATFQEIGDVVRCVQRLATHPVFPAALEMLDPRGVDLVENSPMACGLPKGRWLLLAEIDGPAPIVDSWVEPVAEILRACGSGDVVRSDEPDRRKALWHARKAAGGLLGQISPEFLIQDAVIPKSSLGELLATVYSEADAAGLPVINIFHAGDGNLHPNFMFDHEAPGHVEAVERISARVMRKVAELGGTLSGEHGIGNDKSQHMHCVFGPHARRMQLAVPALFNQQHQLNPMKVFPERRYNRNPDSGAEPNGDARYETPTQQESGASGKPGSGEAHERLFDPFFDPVDLTVCCPAKVTEPELTGRIDAAHAYFPLFADPHTSLDSQIATREYTARSARYGPFADNILGMNWELPGGARVRVGERVVKSSTGYDLMRFLLHAPPRFGRATDYVLRLRARQGGFQIRRVSGSFDRLDALCRELSRSPWLHAIDAVDWIFDDVEADGFLQLQYDTRPENADHYEAYWGDLALRHGVAVSRTERAWSTGSGVDTTIKSTPVDALRIARKIHHTTGCPTVCHATVGYTVVYGKSGHTHVTRELLREWRHETAGAGGHVRAPGFPAPDEEEGAWIERLLEAWGAIKQGER